MVMATTFPKEKRSSHDKKDKRSIHRMAGNALAWDSEKTEHNSMEITSHRPVLIQKGLSTDFKVLSFPIFSATLDTGGRTPKSNPRC
jgi:hypothetical protein